MNFCPCFSHVLSELGEIRCNRYANKIMLIGLREFSQNRYRGGPTFLVGASN